MLPEADYIEVPPTIFDSWVRDCPFGFAPASSFFWADSSSELRVLSPSEARGTYNLRFHCWGDDAKANPRLLYFCP